MANRLDDQLRAFTPGTTTWTACTTLLRAGGASVRLEDWNTLEALASVRGRAEDLDAIRARAAQPAVWAVCDELVGLDGRDGVASALRVAMAAVVRREISGVLRERQGRDAVQKAFVLAWSTARLFDGSPEERVQALLALPTGRALIDLYGVVEVALPFLEEGPNGRRLADLGVAYGVDELKQLCARLGPEANDETHAVLPALLPELDAAVRRSAARAHGILQAAGSLLPGAMTAGDLVGDALAKGVDLLPLYHLLGPRLLAEACVADPHAAPRPAAAWLKAQDPAAEEVLAREEETEKLVRPTATAGPRVVEAPVEAGSSSRSALLTPVSPTSSTHPAPGATLAPPLEELPSEEPAKTSAAAGPRVVEAPVETVSTSRSALLTPVSPTSSTGATLAPPLEELPREEPAKTPAAAGPRVVEAPVETVSTSRSALLTPVSPTSSTHPAPGATLAPPLEELPSDEPAKTSAVAGPRVVEAPVETVFTSRSALPAATLTPPAGNDRLPGVTLMPPLEEDDDSALPASPPAPEAPDLSTWTDPTDETDSLPMRHRLPLPSRAEPVGGASSRPAAADRVFAEAMVRPEPQVPQLPARVDPMRSEGAAIRVKAGWGGALLRLTAFGILAGGMLVMCAGIGTVGLAGTGLLAWIGLEDTPTAEPDPEPEPRRKPRRPRRRPGRR